MLSPPEPAAVSAAWQPSDAVLLDRGGEVLHERRIDATRRRLAWTALGDVSPALVGAVVASEDRRFREHRGVDGRALVAAAWTRLRGGPPRGGSTITMQLAGLLDPTLRRRREPRGLAQKWRQMRLAWALESRWTKDQVLEAYLNLVTFRGELTGVAAAADGIFAKAPHGLTRSESAVLAALLRGPGAPPDLVRRRARAIAGGDVADPIEAAVDRVFATDGPHGPRRADAPHVAQRLLHAGGPTRVAATLDAGLQRLVAQTLRRHLLAVRGSRVTDGAVLVVDNASGEVLAYVGSSGDLSPAPHVDGVRARRQAGSSLKPFLYGLAIDWHLLTPATLLEDAPLEIAVAGGLYRPRNYDESFRGPVSARTALAASLNVPAVRVLTLLGAEAFVEELRGLGFGLEQPGDWYGPALALGSADVTLWELTAAYRALANGGTWSPLRLTPGDSGTEVRRVLSEDAAFLVAHVLADRESRSTTFGLENVLATPFWTAVKTGTSKDMRDNWCVGFSRRYTVGVWVGNFSGAPMQNVSGITGAAPVWVDVMSALHRAVPSPAPAPPPGVVAARVAFAGGVEPERRDWFLRGTEPVAAATLVAARQARIVAPVSGTIIAIDPEIPPDRQRVAFEADGTDAGLHFVLDDVEIGRAPGPLLWQPHPGRHVLALRDEHARLRDTVTFEVRGR
ncbi:MAG TPA: penicillin-binding protein 1C [Candidatus Acidoferrum sp.]|nr:penicillin-binding protein 1C [Candidatus Acidoferrum sp.]